ncbi:probable disease resistance protein At4g27220 [Cornus florida]|uniref:probable disease resistance protein At4g27220 n=1 Tax=Cornus florida TaxID=4283 RepID=UPI002897A450|nr:probable disease resistance protein At4g27220 [Cornus florida]
MEACLIPLFQWVWGITGEPLVNAVKRETGYLVNYDRNIKNVDKEVEKLESLKGSVKPPFEAAKRIGEDTEAGVESWLTEVDTITPVVRKLLEDEANAAKRCLCGWCINCRSRYYFSKKAKLKTDEITALIEEGSKFQILSRPAPPPQIEASSRKDFCTFKTRASVTAEIMDALKDDNTHFIGICGMGGVGKTTLVKEIGRRVKETELFGQVVMAVVSETPILTKIRKEIADMLGCKLDDNVSESQRARLLWQTIKAKAKPVLVILDDVWDKLDLEAVGIPFGDDHKGCKVVLTTRRRDVCYGMGVQKTLHVGVLPNEEAWVLFKEMAGGECVDSNPNARKVSDECGGLPLVIVTMARGLKDKDQYVWAVAAEQLKKSNPKNINGNLEKEVYAKLELSFTYISTEEAQLLFLLCCLFPEDHNIPMEDLTRYAMALRMFEGVTTIEEARGLVYIEVRRLIDSFMLLDGSEKGFVKMHDVLRDVAISISSKPKGGHNSRRKKHEEHQFKVMAGVSDWPEAQTFENYSAISLISNNIHVLPGELQAPNLQILRLQCNSLLQIPNDFFRGSKDQLKFLELSGIHFLPILPPALQPLSSTLRTLHLTSCKLEDISMIEKLTNLEILSFSGSEICEIPVHIAKLTSLRLLDLTNCGKLTKIAPGVICKLPKLEELYLPELFKFDHLVELNSSSRLACLQIFIPIDLLHIDLCKRAQKLTSFNITIATGKGFQIPYEYKPYEAHPYLRMGILRIDHDGNIPLLPDWVKLLLEKTSHLLLRNLKNFNNIFSELNEEGFNSLMSLELYYLEHTKYLVNTMEYSKPRRAFGSLNFLRISYLIHLIEICHGQLPDGSFCNVRELQVHWCVDMEKLVSSSLLVRLNRLEKLHVTNCDKLVHVFEEHVGAENLVLLSMLKEIDLCHLHEMTHVWKDGPHQFISLHNLEKVSVIQCPKLKKLFSPTLLKGLVRLKSLDVHYCDELEEVFGHDKDDPHCRVPCLRSLTSISVHNCEKLKCLFSTSIIQGDLEKLENLRVQSCPALQEIIKDEKGEQEAAAVEKIVIPYLYSISLLYLSKLKSFSTGRYTIEWPSLENLYIDKCPKVETFGNGGQVAPRLKKLKVANGSIDVIVGDLNIAVQEYIKPKAPALEASPSHSSP